MSRSLVAIIAFAAALLGFGLGGVVATHWPAPRLPCRAVLAQTTEGEPCAVLRCSNEVTP